MHIDDTQVFVQSCLNSVGYPDTIEGFRHMAEWRLELSNTIYSTLNTDLFLEDDSEVEALSLPKKNGTLGSWTCPRWFMVGDISFFYHSRRASTNAPRILNKIRKLRDTYRKLEEDLPLEAQSAGRQWLLVLEALAYRGAEFANKYGGKIFAVAKADGEFEVNEPSPGSHWQSIHYCGYSNVYTLDNPLDYDEFRDVVSIEQRSISNLTKAQFDFLRGAIVARNPDVNFLDQIEHRDTRVVESAKARGWRDLVSDPSIRFLFESQVREYILDPFLKEVFPRPHRIHQELPCDKPDVAGGIIDYVISHKAMAIAIEAKCTAIASDELRLQLSKYCDARLRDGGLTALKTHSRCLLLDQRLLYLYDGSHRASDNALMQIATLRELSLMDHDEIRHLILEKLYA